MMKTILILTDFSAGAGRAATYGFRLAEQLKLNIRLCHAINTSTTDNRALTKLTKLKNTLLGKRKKNLPPDVFVPLINCNVLTGTVTDLALILTDASVALTVIGTSGAGGQKKGFNGRDTHDMIESGRLPLLLVPELAPNVLPKKIAFATDLHENDVPILYSLATLARDLQAKIVIIHIDAGDADEVARKIQLRCFLDNVSKDIRFTDFSYRHIESGNISAGLNQILNEGWADMLVMSHNRRSQLESLLDTGDSYTREMAQDLRIPLLVFPKDLVKTVYPVF